MSHDTGRHRGSDDPYWNTLQHAATHCNTLQHTGRHMGSDDPLAHFNQLLLQGVLQCVAMCCSVLQRVAVYCSMLGANDTLAHFNQLLLQGALKGVAVCCIVLQCVTVCWVSTTLCLTSTTGWLRLAGSLKVQISVAEYCLFDGAFLQTRQLILRSLLIVATP